MLSKNVQEQNKIKLVVLRESPHKQSRCTWAQAGRRSQSQGYHQLELDLEAQTHC